MKTSRPVIISVVTIVFSMMFSLTSLALDRLPSGPTYRDVVIAEVKDGGEKFLLRANIYLPVEEMKTPILGKARYLEPEKYWETPTKGKQKPTPLVLFIHGHGGAYNFANGSRSYDPCIALTERGIAVATIDYRPKNALPDDIFDVKAYIRYFRANAAKFNIDPNRIGVWGTSRGGNLAALIAATGDSKDHEGDVGGNLDQSSRVQCAVIYYPMTDIFFQPKDRFPTFFLNAPREAAAGIQEANEKNDSKSQYWKYVQAARLSNPINFVDKDDPPILLAHGAKDPILNVKHSYVLYDKYVEAGVPAWLYIYSKGGHGTVSPDVEQATQDWIANMLLVELSAKK